MRKFYLTGVLACLSFLFSYSQPSVRSTIDRQEILIGEQFHLKVEAGFSPAKHRLQWISIPDSLQHFEVVERSKIDSVYSGNQLTAITQTFTLTSFDSGKWVLPTFAVAFDPVKGDSAYNFFTDSFPVTVAFSTSDTTSQLRDIKPIREVTVKNNRWYFIAGAILLLCIIGYLVWRFRKKKPIKPLPVIKRSKLSAYDEAMQALNQLQQYDFSKPADTKLVHSKLAEILKQYLSRRENDDYYNKTTSDVLIGLKQIGVSPDMLSGLAGTLRLGDAVKFAKYLPPPAETGDSIQAVKALIESFKLNTSSKPA
jgi:LPXTG-motif cell wall-anchored protein